MSPALPFDPVSPSPAESRLAGAASERLGPLIRRDRPLRLSAGAKGETVEVPGAAADLLLRVLREMAAGNAVTLIPIHAELSTQQAADLLGVSRPFLIRLIDEGRLPCRRVGAHRRLRFRDVMAFKERSDAERAEALAKLAAEAQEHGLGY